MTKAGEIMLAGGNIMRFTNTENGPLSSGTARLIKNKSQKGSLSLLLDNVTGFIPPVFVD